MYGPVAGQGQPKHIINYKWSHIPPSPLPLPPPFRYHTSRLMKSWIEWGEGARKDLNEPYKALVLGCQRGGGEG